MQIATSVLRINILKARDVWELLTRKSVNKKLVNEDDLKQYKNILNRTSAHLEGYKPDAPIHVSREIKGWITY
jgi:hypothetical protein